MAIQTNFGVQENRKSVFLECVLLAYLHSPTYHPCLVTSDRWTPSNYPITENIRAIYLTLEKLIQSEETQVNGIVILADYKGVSLSKASHFGPFVAKKVIGILQVRPELVGK